MAWSQEYSTLSPQEALRLTLSLPLSCNRLSQPHRPGAEREGPKSFAMLLIQGIILKGQTQTGHGSEQGA